MARNATVLLAVWLGSRVSTRQNRLRIFVQSPAGVQGVLTTLDEAHMQFFRSSGLASHKATGLPFTAGLIRIKASSRCSALASP